MTIQRCETRPSGWTSYVCSDCQAQWDVHAHEDPAVVTAHPEEECQEVQRENAELAKLPRGTYARYVNGGFLKVG